MSTGQAAPAPGASSPAMPPSSSQTSRPQRVLACVICHARKVKCDRKFPCSNCVKGNVQCVPAAVTRRRPRRPQPEKALLDRLHQYEELLRNNSIKFEPLHKAPTTETVSPNTEHEAAGYASDDDQPPDATGTPTDAPSPSTTAKSDKPLQSVAKNFWQLVNSGFRDSTDNEADHIEEDVRAVIVRKAWEQATGDSIFLALGSRGTPISLSFLQPETVQIIRFWQIYLDNVNPLLKVTHAPSLQGRIIEAIGNLGNVSPTLEALMFGIYCVSIITLSADDCRAMFGSPKEELLTSYQTACQQALVNCKFLQTNDRDCLTALFLYMISVSPSTDPMTLSSMLGNAYRIACRMGIHREASLAKCSPFEAEMRRRLWWSFVLFDNRIGELADSKCGSLNPTWDCNIPLNVNDSDLRPEMKEAATPQAQGYTTDTIHVAVRSEFGNFLRHYDAYLDFTNPSLKRLTKDARDNVPEIRELDALEKMIEDTYLKLCDPEVPLHFFTIWFMRGLIAKCHLVTGYAKSNLLRDSTAEQVIAQLDLATNYAMRALECDTKISSSPLTKNYHWVLHFHFPFPAYIQIVVDLRKRPFSKHADRVWDLMSDHCEARFSSSEGEVSVLNALFQVFSKTILPAWDEREAAAKESQKPLGPTPRIVTFIRDRLDRIARDSQGGQDSNTARQQASDLMNLDDVDYSMSVPMTMSPNSLNTLNNLMYGMGMGMGGQAGSPGTMPGLFPPTPAPNSLDINQVDWAPMGWGPGERRGW
ncbi:Uu.00g070630.m01.CDS01 [Anthostomella pinea]|uniref:Uu.00g070630.m01.CDS01 n=1 Tax=Anthostomella pinea TaxID=933095 RepID=A0AAI8VUR5_9PEZI|nr:Uu.00g070630.m01.CDS01 [Anthostomella pinea]